MLQFRFFQLILITFVAQNRDFDPIYSFSQSVTPKHVYCESMWLIVSH